MSATRELAATHFSISQGPMELELHVRAKGDMALVVLVDENMIDLLESEIKKFRASRKAA